MRPPLLSLFALAIALPAQEMITLGHFGGVFTTDSEALATTRLGPGRFGLVSLATDGRSLWSCEGIDPDHGHLVAIDPVTGVATDIANTFNYFGLTGDGLSTLYGVRTIPTTASNLAIIDRIDPHTGQATQVATYVFFIAAPCALAVVRDTLYCWDGLRGLLRVDLGTGTVVAPFLPLRDPPHVRFLCGHPDGRLLCGDQFGPTTFLAQIDLTTGAVTRLGSMGAIVIDGCAVPGNPRTMLGPPCADAAGPARLRLPGTWFVGATATAVSTNHALGSIGAMLFGWSTTNYAGQPLPRLLDPLLGTNGCFLYTSIDASLLGPTSTLPPGDLSFSFTLPPAAVGLSFAMQHAAFAPVPGHMSWSNGIAIQLSQ